MATTGSGPLLSVMPAPLRRRPSAPARRCARRRRRGPGRCCRRPPRPPPGAAGCRPGGCRARPRVPKDTVIKLGTEGVARFIELRSPVYGLRIIIYGDVVMSGDELTDFAPDGFKFP